MIIRRNILKLLAGILGATIVLGGCAAVDTPVQTAGEENESDMQVDMQTDTSTDELTINAQLLQYLDMTYAQFKEQIGTEAEFYHGLYFQAAIPGKGANVVFQGKYDEEVAGSVLSDEDKSFRVESSLNNIINGITKEMTVTQFMEMLGLYAGFAYEMHPDIQEGLTAYYVAYHYVETIIDSNGDGILDIQLSIALDEADHIMPDASTWIYESSFFKDSEQDEKPSEQDAEHSKQDIELSEQDAELINMAIHDKEHNIYTGSIGNAEIRMRITRTGDSLTAAYINREGEERTFQGELKKDSPGFTLNADSGEFLEGSISETDSGQINISGESVIPDSDIAFTVFTLHQDTFFPIGEDTENYYASLGYEAEAVEQFAKQIKDSVSDKTAFAKLISYPISIQVDGSNVSIESEEGMLDVYDELMEQNGFKQQIGRIYTKYMFANYMGISVENGMIWFDMDSSGDFKIYAINPPS